MSTVEKIRESTWQKDGQDVVTYWVTMGGREVPCYDAQAKSLALNSELPEGWEVRQSKAGKDYLKPPGKQGGGKAFSVAHRNTKEGQEYEQEAMDRRTALMQSVFIAGDGGFSTQLADSMYAWLRATKTSGGAGNSPQARHQPPEDSSELHEGAVPIVGKEPGRQGVAVASAPTDCPHHDLAQTTLKPDNKTSLPAGFIRCSDCGWIRKGSI